MLKLLRVALLAQLLATLPAQSISPLGTGCGARGTVLDAYGAPVPGQTIEFHLRDAAPSALHVLVLGSSSSSWGGTPLPLAAPAGLGFAPGCTLFVSIDVWAGVLVGAAGTGVFTLPLPPGIAGTFYLQALGLLPVQQSGIAVTCTLPTDPDLLPVGHYFLFAMVDDIPSVAAIVRVQG